jgi:hypothetical protein
MCKDCFTVIMACQARLPDILLAYIDSVMISTTEPNANTLFFKSDFRRGADSLTIKPIEVMIYVSQP